jgi:hypothetical protein
VCSSKLALDLDTSPAFEKGLGPQSRVKQAVDFLVIGSRNASKLATCLSNKGYTQQRCYMRLTGASVQQC